MMNWFYKNPIKLFLIDGAGALYSAFMLGVVLVHFNGVFGIPVNVLYFLAALPCVFAVYDFFCYFSMKNKSLPTFLRIIATVNLLYCCISLALSLYHYAEIKTLGWVYILGEMAIVAALAVIEWRVAKRKTFNSQ